MRVLAGITNYGEGNRVHLERLLEEYRTMTFKVDIAVFSDRPKSLGADVEVVVGLPTPNPWSLGFAHRRAFMERSGDYDLFIYSEDDTLITEDHIRAYLEADSLLPREEIAGFLRYEQDEDGRRYCSTVHSRFHWQPGSLKTVGGRHFARFTNDHAASYLLTRQRLDQAIRSGGYTLEPHQGRYDLLCSAATDPYTRCGMRKLICLTGLERFLLPHLPNKYIGRLGIPLEELQAQLGALETLSTDGGEHSRLFPVATRTVRTARWDKLYYEPVQAHLVESVPEAAVRILSVGCGWGATEAELARRGCRVTALTLDGVIAASARLRGVEVAGWQLEGGLERLSGRRFDCILLSRVLEHLPDPATLLLRLGAFLEPGGMIAGSTANLTGLLARRAFLSAGMLPGRSPGACYRTTGLYPSGPAALRRWLHRAGFRDVRIRFRGSRRPIARLAPRLLEPEVVFEAFADSGEDESGKKAGRKPGNRRVPR